MPACQLQSCYVVSEEPRSTAFYSISTAVPICSQGSEEAELVKRSASQSSTHIDFVDKDIGGSPHTQKNDREGKTIWQKLKSVSSSLL